jgi:predicted dehydrogenase
VVGAGAFGRNHARVFHELEKSGEAVHLAAIVDIQLDRAAALAKDYEQFGTQSFAVVKELVQRGGIHAASVAVPTLQHLEVARALMSAGVDVLIEKPLAANLAEADELIRLAQQHGRIAQVGHLERFNPAVRATLPLITKPMFFEVHRLSVFSPRALDVDVVLDLMIHDLDIVLSFVSSPVKEVRAVGLPILSSKVDIANVRMEFDSGCVANFTASRVSTERIRKLRFFQPRQYVSLDYTRQDVLLFTVGEGGSEGPGFVPPGLSLPSGLQIRVNKVQTSPEEPLKAELKSFLESVRTRRKPLVPIEDGRRALAVALDILNTVREHGRKIDVEGLHRIAPGT